MIRIFAFLLGMVFFNKYVNAMEFHMVGNIIRANGSIEDGDSTKLARLVREKNLASGSDVYSVRLASPGGLTLEGSRLGEVIRDARLETFVARSDSCASACALAFLGGTRRYATGTGVGRRIEFGASLGFHGFRSNADSVQLENKTLDMSRVLTGIILDYAARMKSIDLGWLARTLNVPPSDLYFVNRPIDLVALSIDVEGIPLAVPREWHMNACRLVVLGETPVLDHVTARVLPRFESIPTIRNLRNLLIDGRFPTGPISAIAATLPDSDAIDLALGTPFFLDLRKPILDAKLVDLRRGAGFYYDKCIAVRTNRDISVILIDQLSNILLHKQYSERSRTNFRLAMFDASTPLWP